MKINALLVLSCNGVNSSPSSSSTEANPIILANACDVSQFRFYKKLVLVNSLFLLEYKVHSYNRNGLCALGFTDDHYPVRSAFYFLNKVLDEYEKEFGDSWKTAQIDATQPWPYLTEALNKFHDPAEADQLLAIQRELDETKILLHKTIDGVLERGEKLDSLVEKSKDLTAASHLFYKQAKNANQCCTIL
ncbi:hypothetical protein MKW94_029708 [Papaver nudicaule]|uniref:VAMP-like protein YKT61 n=1 Tax=Papaver nudicaule TaxID=74823 RepID=A0AA41UX17_PAPNU|nr:hypothetical protein [Papaver nudicaule]